MSVAEGALTGCVILLTRPAAQGRGLARRLARFGARVECRPTIALVPPRDPEPARRAVAGLDRFDWLLFTSANGVRFFLDALQAAGGQPSQVLAAVGAVGPATASELTRAGLVPSVVARESHAEGLSRALTGRVAPGARVLVVHPEGGRSVLVDALSEQGAQPSAVAFYRNVAAPDIGGVARDVCEGRFDVGVFTSPSSVSHLIRAPGFVEERMLVALGRMRLVAIGPITARALVDAGLRPKGVAPDPDDERIARAVVEAYLR